MLDLAKPFYPLFFSSLKGNPEEAHLQLLNTLSVVQNSQETFWKQWLIEQLDNSFTFEDSRLSQRLWGLPFSHVMGLAPGFDKDGICAGMWHHFGFAFAELGAVTFHPQTGNPRPRLFRLPQDKAVLNRMGANNLGAKVMAETLGRIWQNQPRLSPIGINLCKSKITPLESSAIDYVESFQWLKPHADYFVVNVSSPNTPGLRSLQSIDQLKPIFDALQGANQGEKPILVKIAPDLSDEDILSLVTLAQEYGLSGIVATNTTISRQGLKTKILPETGRAITEETGGVSGYPLKSRSTEVIRLIYQHTQGSIPIIGLGGIFNSDDAWEKITAGASLLQIYTGWIYEGPWMLKTLLKGLIQKVEQSGLSHISEAIGMEGRSNPST